MKRIGWLLLAGALTAWTASAQDAKTSRDSSGQKEKAQTSGGVSASSNTSASAQAGQNSASLSAGTTFEAALSGSLDARKNKEGDRVAAHTTQAVKQDGQVVIPKGAKVIGHVTEAKARAQGESESALGIMFDKAVLRNGQEIPLHVAVQALAAAQTAASSPAGDMDTMGSASGMASGSGRAPGSGGGLVGAVGSSAGATAGAVTNTAGTVGSAAGGAVNSTVNTAASATGNAAGAGVGGMLNSSSTGVIGLQGLSLNSEASNATQGSVIVSSTKNVHLDSGTRLLLRAQAQ